jgi:hypothetical protein
VDREGKLSARCEGFSLQAGRHLQESDRESVGVSNCVSPAGLGCGAWPETSNWPCW